MTSEKLPISAFIICLNEIKYLGNCIESLECCNEIIVVDSGSTDGTQQLIEDYAKKGFPIRLIHNNWPGYAAQKQFALEQCTEKWCISIDADERLDKALRQELPELINAPDDIVGWRIARRPYLIGYGYTPEWARERKILRIIRNSFGKFDLSLKVHEGIIPEGKVLDSKKGSLLHFRPLPIGEQILKENKYSSLKVDMRIEKGEQPSLSKLLFGPPLYFLRLYILNGLWRCGVPGFIQAVVGGMYKFLTEAKTYHRKAMEKPIIDPLSEKVQK